MQRSRVKIDVYISWYNRVFCVHVDKTRENFRQMGSNLLILRLNLVHVLRLSVDYERLHNLHEIQRDWEQVHPEVVNVDIEAITLVRPEAVSSGIVQELVRLTIGLQVDHEDVRGRENLERGVKHALAMVKTLNQVVDGLDSVIVQAVLVDDDTRVVVNAFADAAHESFKLGHAPYNELVGHFVLLVVIVHADLRLGL